MPQPRLIDLHIACLLDEGVDLEIAKALPATKAARHDKSVVDSLRKLYRRVDTITLKESDPRWIEHLLKERPDVVFNLAQSACPMEPSVAACLEVCGCAYTGSGPRGIMLANDKVRSRLLLQASGLRIPQFVELPPFEPIRISLEPPFIVKPASLAGSTGIYSDSVTMNANDVPRLAHRIWARFSVSALCEQFIVGREFRVGIIEDEKGRLQSTGIFESIMTGHKPGWGFRTDAIRNNPRVGQANKATQRRTTRPAGLVEALLDASRQAMSVLDVTGYATLDVRVGASGEPVILEVNANPGLVAGPFWGARSFPTTLHCIIQSGIRRYESNDKRL